MCQGVQEEESRLLRQGLLSAVEADSGDAVIESDSGDAPVVSGFGDSRPQSASICAQDLTPAHFRCVFCLLAVMLYEVKSVHAPLDRSLVLLSICKDTLMTKGAQLFMKYSCSSMTLTEPASPNGRPCRYQDTSEDAWGNPLISTKSACATIDPLAASHKDMEEMQVSSIPAAKNKLQHTEQLQGSHAYVCLQLPRMHPSRPYMGVYWCDGNNCWASRIWATCASPFLTHHARTPALPCAAATQCLACAVCCWRTMLLCKTVRKKLCRTTRLSRVLCPSWLCVLLSGM